MQSTFSKLFDELKELYEKKNQDYAIESNTYSNFEIAANVAGISVYEQILSLMGTKIARIRNLLDRGIVPNNESLEDSFRDLTVYAGIMASYYIDRKTNT